MHPTAARRRILVPVLALLLPAALPAAAQPTAELKCEAAKKQEAAKYAACLLKAEGKLLLRGEPDKYDQATAKCDARFATVFERFEQKAAARGESCPTSDDGAAAATYVTSFAAFVTAATEPGGAFPPIAGPDSCGNGTVEPGEDCDLGNLGGADCATVGFGAGSLACAPGCVFDSSACFTGRFTDHGDGTVTDQLTGLMWEKKDDSGGVRDKDHTWTWSTGEPFGPGGSVFTTFLYALNGGTSGDGVTTTGCLAGHCDWRLPTIQELQTLLLAPFPCATSPCIDPAFGPTRPGNYWSITGQAGFTTGAWTVFFDDGALGASTKVEANFARAVRSVR